MTRDELITSVARMIARLDLGHPCRVAVDGVTAAGKTTFAAELTAALDRSGRPADHVTMDGFHHVRAVRHRQGRASAAGYYEDAYDLAALRAALLDPLGPGGDRRYRRAVLDLATDQPVTDPPVIAAGDLVVVVDGSFLHRPEVRGGWDVTVLLACPLAAAEARGVARDAAALGGVDAARALFHDRYHAAQRRYLAEIDPAAQADVVIDHVDPTAPAIRRVAAWLSSA